jgi:hypothetical protein
MKLRIVLLSLVAVLLLSAVAEAAQFLPFGQARRLSKVWTREACEARGPSCGSWKVGHCGRIAPERVDCVAAVVFKSGEFCVFILENRVKSDGFIHQRRRHLECEHV